MTAPANEQTPSAEGIGINRVAKLVGLSSGAVERIKAGMEARYSSRDLTVTRSDTYVKAIIGWPRYRALGTRLSSNLIQR